MRIDVKKYLFVGLEKDRKPFFETAQEEGIIHFIENSGSKNKELPPDVHEMVSAIKILRGLPTAQQEELSTYSGAKKLAHTIVELRNKIEQLAEQGRVLNMEIARVAPFGDFSIEDIAYIEKKGKRKVQFFFTKAGAFAEAPLPEGMVFVTSDHGLDYYVAINPEPTQYTKAVEMRFDQSLNKLKENAAQIENEMHAAEHQLKGFSKYNTYLHHALVDQLNSHNLHTAQNRAQLSLENQLFVVSGWVPVNKTDQLLKLAAEKKVFVEEVAIESTDAIPTYLENTGLNKIGEDLVHVYDAPSPTDDDPSLWVLASFTLFFSFIVGDGGYGLLFLAAALYIRFKYFGMGEKKKRLLNLFTILCCGIVVWGLLTGTFFGITLSPENPLRKASLVEWLVVKKLGYHMQLHDSVYQNWLGQFPQLANVQDPYQFMVQAKNSAGEYVLLNKFSDQIMLELALFIGVVHVLLSMARYLKRNPVNIGWILFIIGCYLYFPSYLDAPTMMQYVFHVPLAAAASSGMYLIIGGISLATVISIFRNKFTGILEPMTAIQVFADILSYLRLYALGLAGSIVASVINESLASVNIVIGAVLIVAGHVINMALAIMGGVIHGLRLNFLEWYHYSFEGGGKMFNPLHKMKVE